MATEAVIELKVGSQTVTLLSVEWNLVGPNDTQPIPTTGYTVISTPIEIDGIKYWVEWKPT